MLDHEDECDKVNYEGGTCTCGLIHSTITGTPTLGIKRTSAETGAF